MPNLVPVKENWNIVMLELKYLFLLLKRKFLMMSNDTISPKQKRCVPLSTTACSEMPQSAWTLMIAILLYDDALFWSMYFYFHLSNLFPFFLFFF